jgi:hypothetical protein
MRYDTSGLKDQEAILINSSLDMTKARGKTNGRLSADQEIVSFTRHSLLLET